MTIEYSWKIVRAAAAPSLDGLSTVVTSVDAVYSAFDGTNKVTLPLTVQFGSPNPGDFTPYDQLTEQMMINWVQDQLSTTFLTEGGVDYLSMYETQLTDRLNNIYNPQEINPPLPWA